MTEQKANESKRGDAMRWTGSPKGENAGCSRVNGARGKRCDIDNAKRWAQPENREDRVNHLIPQPCCYTGFPYSISEWLLVHSLATFSIRGSQPVRFHEDCERGASGIISRKARRR